MRKKVTTSTAFINIAANLLTAWLVYHNAHKGRWDWVAAIVMFQVLIELDRIYYKLDHD
jgi:hypothetical protein